MSEFMKVPDIADRWDIPISTAYVAIADLEAVGEIEVLHIGRLIRVKKSSLLGFEDRQTKK